MIRIVLGKTKSALRHGFNKKIFLASFILAFFGLLGIGIYTRTHPTSITPLDSQPIDSYFLPTNTPFFDSSSKQITPTSSIQPISQPNSGPTSIPNTNPSPTIVPPSGTSVNLIQNPWFKSGFVGWVDATGPEGHWSISQKPGNPSPDAEDGTSARISTGRGDGETGATVPINYDAYLYQIVQADPTKSYLEFDMYWVAHTINPGEVTIYGGSGNSGPWQEVWKPFHKVILTVLKPPPGTGSHNQYLWDYYSATTSMVGKDIGAGYPYYKLELHGNLPDESGGFKVTGIHFGVK